MAYQKISIITIDDILKLRREKRYEEAEEKLKEFHNNNIIRSIEHRKSIENSLIREERKLKAKNGVCTRINCNHKTPEGYKLCDKCRQKKREATKRLRDKKVMANEM